MTYVDGFVVPVPTAKREAYRKLATEAATIWKEHGALKVVECWSDDVPEGKLTSFPMSVKRGPDETVVFSWVVWPSRAVRDEGRKKVPQEGDGRPAHAVDQGHGKRVIYGGFEVILDA